MDIASQYLGAPVIAGGGLAGVLTALQLAPMPVILCARSALGGETSSAWAQGGIAVALGPDDSAEEHAADTITASSGLCDPMAVQRIIGAGRHAVEVLERWGIRFDRAADGSFALGREAAHSQRRIVHVGGDATGAGILRSLVEAARAIPSILILEHTVVDDVLTRSGRVVGVVLERNGHRDCLATDALILATGGIGGLFRETTNPVGSTGAGLALAARAGALLRDLEFVQFHPTALAVGRDPMPLVSEALRGEGARLIDANGSAVMGDISGGDLAPRDVVARAIFRRLAAGGRVYLDARKAVGSRFAQRFPNVYALCQDAGVDPVTQPIPVAPAAHYHMGGVEVDASGRSSVEGLWAVGEVASTGLHGANRLASNSLLEAAVGAIETAAAVSERQALQSPIVAGLPGPARVVLSPTDRTVLRRIMSDRVGVVRDADGLGLAQRELAELPPSDPVIVARLIVAAAAQRRESRGSHYRSDYPLASGDEARHSRLTVEAVTRPAAE